jgi:protein phosphatase
VLWAVAVLVVLGGIAAGVYTYAQDQYYVGFDDDDHVAVFRGVQGSVAGVHFSSVDARSTLTREQLSDVEAERVEDGIPATDEHDAQTIVQRLIEQSQCDTPLPAPIPTLVASPAPTAATPAPVPSPSPTATDDCS